MRSGVNVASGAPGRKEYRRLLAKTNLSDLRWAAEPPPPPGVLGQLLRPRAVHPHLSRLHAQGAHAVAWTWP